MVHKRDWAFVPSCAERVENLLRATHPCGQVALLVQPPLITRSAALALRLFRRRPGQGLRWHDRRHHYQQRDDDVHEDAHEGAERSCRTDGMTRPDRSARPVRSMTRPKRPVQQRLKQMLGLILLLPSHVVAPVPSCYDPSCDTQFHKHTARHRVPTSCSPILTRKTTAEIIRIEFTSF